ncbi:hydrolase [Paraliobacillus quinghaiensis]|uniref:Hydrolase n=1 Tax=Paraliobacillus quinghaiensis TaxID=470815 RepID=A0A917WTY9_9BACI|nr:HAD family hydrolase [Paraliobacillus quinghaiensis]GGM27742.1 hydrolase [Paraliobacillus quinghaiensis]
MQTVIFDVDDTLYDQTSPFKKAVQEQFTQSFTEKELTDLYIASRKHDLLFQKNCTGELSIVELQTYRITEACREFGITLSYQEAINFQDAYLAEQQKITLYEEVEELLNILYQQNIQLAVLTNGEKDHQSMKIKQLDLVRWIPEEHFFISGALGHAKPAQEVFTIIENKLQIDRTNTIYIGDFFEHDVVGAKQAGWQSIWMNHRHRQVPTTSVKPDKVVYSAKELLEIFQADYSLVV